MSTLVARIVDQSGKASDGAVTPGLQITVDTDAPQAAVLGSVGGDDVVNAAEQGSALTGTAEAGARVTLTLAGSGHIAGVVNAPSANKYQHWVNPALPDTLAEWQAGAEEHPGSWWPHWAQWLHARSGEWVAARDPNKGPLSPLEPAPGSYVKVKS